MTRKTSSDVADLLDKLVEAFDDILTNGEKEVTKEGEVVRVSPKAATLNTIRQFIDSQKVSVLVNPNTKAGQVSAKLMSLPFRPDQVVPDEKVG